MLFIFRAVVSFLILFLLLWYFLPWGWAYSDSDVYRFFGSGALLSDQFVVFSSNMVSLLYLISYVGLILFRWWARSLLLFISIFGGVIIPVYGVSISSGPESMLMHFLSLGDGFVLALAYFSSLNARFNYVKS